MKELAKRIQQIPPYLFADIERKIAAAREAGRDIISLGIGDPDLPTPQRLVEELCRTAHDAVNHQYPSSQGMLSFRQAVAEFYAKRFGVEDIDPAAEVCALIGSKEGIANINYCFVDTGDINLIPDPSYPVYATATMLAGGVCYSLPLDASRGFLPDLAAIPGNIADRAKLLWLNYPNNPTGAVTDLAFFEEAVAFARRHDVLICHDNAYSEMTYDGYIAPSILQVPGAKEVAVEFGSCSKPFNMTGWRIGFIAGNARAVNALATYKSNVDSGVFQAVQYAGQMGLLDPEQAVSESRAKYAARRDILVGGLNEMGWNLASPKGTFYVWAPVPKGFSSASFAEYILDEAQVVITPGSGYGPAGEGYFRATLTTEENRMAEAIARMKNALGSVTF
ncbi:MAG: LL-diaminopimelate aminotransferase [Clostridia bacterium]|nr:LL-diaminopimelate aminotransferase [Clostridia bacterium]